jgi:hypothetical protein
MPGLRPALASWPLELGRNGKIDSAGELSIELGPPPPDVSWDIDRLVVSTTGAAVPIVALYRGTTPTVGTFLDGTVKGQQAVAEYGPALHFEANEAVTLVWKGATPGAAATVLARGRGNRSQPATASGHPAHRARGR